MAEQEPFNDEQKNYLQGLAMGLDVARAARGLPILSGGGESQGTQVRLGPDGTEVAGGPAGPERVHRESQDRFLAEGKTLSKEEQAKRDKDALTMWNDIRENARQGVFPKGTDVFLYKFHGLFHVAPAQNAFMCRLRLPGGILSAWQFRGVADLARRYGGGYADVTTRANLQIREIGPGDATQVLTGLTDLGILTRGAGADNVRNITTNPTSGIDPREWIETLPLARELHHEILNRRDLYGLPRKFNIAFDGGGLAVSLEETNDIGFRAVKVEEASADEQLPAGLYFSMALGGITGHGDFARPTGVLVRPEDCVPVAVAVLRVFIQHGDRTDRKKARLKYLLDAWGVDRFLQAVEEELGAPLLRTSLDRCVFPDRPDRQAHVGVHPQRQEGLNYIGVLLPVGRMTSEQMEGLAAIAERHGSGAIRLTVWQNLLISDIPTDRLGAVQQEIEALGLDWNGSSIRSGLVACTGNTGCKYSAANTKGQALLLANHLEERIALDQPINIHLTGCHHSCAQHYIGDIGLEATKVEVDNEELVEGYHLCVGGGSGADQGIGRRVLDSVPFDEIPPIVERLLRFYLEHRQGPEESFVAFSRGRSIEELRAVASESLAETR